MLDAGYPASAGLDKSKKTLRAFAPPNGEDRYERSEKVKHKWTGKASIIREFYHVMKKRYFSAYITLSKLCHILAF